MGFVGFVLGIVGSLALVAVVRRASRRSPGWQPSWSASADGAVVIHDSLARALTTASKAIATIDRFESVNVDERNATIVARFSGDLKTFAKVITIRGVAEGSTQTRLEIHSRLTIPQWYDWGANRKLVGEVQRVCEAYERVR